MYFIATLNQRPLTVHIPMRLHPYVVCARNHIVIPCIQTNDAAANAMVVIHGRLQPIELVHDQDLYKSFMNNQTTKISSSALKTCRMSKAKCSFSVSTRTQWHRLHPYYLVQHPINQNTGLILVDEEKTNGLECTIIDPIHNIAIFQDTLSELF